MQDTDQHAGFDLDRQREQIAEIEASRPEPNADYSPTDKEELVLDIMREEGRATTGLLKKRGRLDTNYGSEMVVRLTEHGWLWRVVRPNEKNYGQPEEIDGLYEFNGDPRTEDGPYYDRQHADE